MGWYSVITSDYKQAAQNRKIKVTRSFETPVNVYQYTRYHRPQN